MIESPLQACPLLKRLWERIWKYCGKIWKCSEKAFCPFSLNVHIISKMFPMIWISIQFVFCKFFVNMVWILSQTNPDCYVSAVQVFWKHCGKRRNCLQGAISPFSTVFSTLLKNFLPLSPNLKLSSANSFRLEESKICRLGKVKNFVDW